MFYEIAIKVTRIQDNGKEKEVLERYITDCNLFSEAELKGMKEYSEYGLQGDVVGIKRSNIYEILNDKEVNDNYYRAKLASVFIDENNEKEKMTYYHVLVAAENMDAANRRMQEYMKAGMSDFLLLEIKETKILDLLQ